MYGCVDLERYVGWGVRYNVAIGIMPFQGQKMLMRGLYLDISVAIHLGMGLGGICS